MKVEELFEKNWSDPVTHTKHPGTFAKKGTHTGTAEEIYREYKKPSVSPHGTGSAIQMLQFYINRAGKNLKNGPALHAAMKMLQADLKKEHEKDKK